jgi:hypothetical protein
MSGSGTAARANGSIHCVILPDVELSEVFHSLGRTALDELLRHVSLGTLKAYNLFEQLKIRAHLTKLNTEHLRNAAPRLWERLEEHDEDLARELAQAVLVSNMAFVVEALNFLKVPHENGFLPKDFSPDQHLSEGWQQRLLQEFRGRHPEALIKLYINHLMWEADKQASVFVS